MCGFAGFLNKTDAPANVGTAKSMAEMLVHRGPDGSGAYSDGPLAFGHRRLKVIDFSAAADQPMLSGDGRHALVYNGEVYNFRELRRELEGLGVKFRSQGDTEVVLAALIQWGEAALRRFNGMFSLVLWDSKEKSLLFAVDRYGIKPLHYTAVRGALLFGSEIKSFLAHPEFRVELNQEALVEYLTFQNLFRSHSLFAGVKRLPAGTYALVKRNDPTVVRPVKYWDFAFREPARARSRADYVADVSDLFKQAVIRQCVSDVAIGGYLSSGIDSTAITAFAVRERPDFKTFTIGFDMRNAENDQGGGDEREQAAEIALSLGTDHYATSIGHRHMQGCMEALVAHVEEPRVGQSYPNYYAAELAAKHVKVVLSGTGGDELFGGYPWRYHAAIQSRSFDEFVNEYCQAWQRLAPQETLSALLMPMDGATRHIDTQEIFRDVFSGIDANIMTPEGRVNASLYFEAKTFLQGLLAVEDRLSMAHGIEGRVPFLDNDLVDYAMEVPVGLKLNSIREHANIDENEPGKKVEKYFQRHHDGKLILRQALENVVPAEIAKRHKQGFSGPDETWFRTDSLDYVNGLLRSDDARIFEFLDRGTVDQLIDEHVQGRANRRLMIWSLLNLEVWCRRFS